MLSPGLHVQAAPTIAMTPQLRQSLVLLQLPALELGQALQAALATNPFLESASGDGGDGDVADASMENDWSASDGDAIGAPAELAADLAVDGASLDFDPRAAPGGGRTEALPDATARAAAPIGLREHLHRQIGASRLTARERLLADLVAEAVDDDGYLRVALDDLATTLPGPCVEMPALVQALRFVQSLDPAGVAARSPAECLALQLEALPGEQPRRALALRLVREHLPLLARHDVARLCELTGADEQAVCEAHTLILRLDPHPGHRFGADETHFVVADVIVEPGEGGWTARINPQTLPRLRINQHYVNALRGAAGDRGGAMAQQLQEARWLLRSVRQRYETIERVAQAVVDRQRRFFEHGDIALQPLLQRDIAHALEIHPSTVSRVSQGKFMATPHGLVAFSRFFDAGVQATDGSPCAATAVRALIREILDAEDPAQPLSDLKLTRRLVQRGVRVARRTVTKYRDAMGIAPWQARRLAAAAHRTTPPAPRR